MDPPIQDSPQYNGKLPPDVMFNIIMNVTSLDALTRLLDASPEAKQLFDLYARQIMNSVLAHESEQVRSLVIIIAHIRAGTIPQHHRSTWKRFSNDFVKPTMAIWHNQPSEGDFRPTQLPESCSVALLHGILQTHREILSKTFHCIEKLFKRRYEPLQPRRVANPSFRFRKSRKGVPDHGARWQHPQSIPYPKVNSGTPTWLEEQRVIRAGWRIQLILELQDAVSKGDFFADPNANYLFRPGYICPLEFWYIFTEFVPNIDTADPLFLQKNRLEYHVLWTVEEYFTRARGVMRLRSWPVPSASNGDDQKLMDDHCWVWYFFTYHVAVNELHGVMPFQPFETFGFPIWTERRLQSYGFLPGGPDPDVPDDGYTYLWRSVLNPIWLSQDDRSTHGYVDQHQDMMKILSESSDPAWKGSEERPAKRRRL